MNGIKDHILRLPAPSVAGDHIAAAPNDNPIDIAPLKLVLVAQPFKNALVRVALFAGTVGGVLQPLIDEAGEPVQLGPLDICRSVMSGRDQNIIIFFFTLARGIPKWPAGRPFAHAASTREADLQL